MLAQSSVPRGRLQAFLGVEHDIYAAAPMHTLRSFFLLEQGFVSRFRIGCPPFLYTSRYRAVNSLILRNYGISMYWCLRGR